MTIPSAVPPGLQSAQLKKEKHILYWKRCLRTYLPHHYTSNDCHRLLLVYFILAALDLLGVLQDTTTEEERRSWADWVYTCQHPGGGFRGSPATDLGEHATESGNVWDPANVPGTYFALVSLILLGDDLGRVDRAKCLQWLNRMQRPDGSFGELVGKEGRVEGGMDTRFGYTATGIRWILRGRREGEVEGVPDIDVDKLVICIQKAETYEGGISEAPFHEPHGGYTFCALGALAFLGRLRPESITSPSTPPDPKRPTAPTNVDLTLHWLVSRQTATLDEEDEGSTYGDETDTSDTCHDAHSAVFKSKFVSQRGAISYAKRDPIEQELKWVGWNGRCNKIADTCYCWWGTAALKLFDRVQLCNMDLNRNYLLEKTQHAIGGFGKHPGYPPDLYHSYLGLAALSILEHPELKPINPAACFSWDAVRYLESLPWRRKIWVEPER